MIRTLSLVAATLLITSTAAFAQTVYSIQITGFCDHLTVTSSGGTVYGNSDASSCDTSAVIGNGKGKALSAAGDLGYGPVDSWNWNFKLGKKGNGTGTLTGTSGGAIIAGPLAFNMTYSKSGDRHPPVNNHLPSVSSLFTHK
jgi:hypothetical protein